MQLFRRGRSLHAQWAMSLDNLTTHTTISPIRRRFIPGFVNYKKGCTRHAASSDKLYQLLAYGRWFSMGTPAFSTTKTVRHDRAEILLKVALNIKNSQIVEEKCVNKGVTSPRSVDFQTNDKYINGILLNVAQNTHYQHYYKFQFNTKYYIYILCNINKRILSCTCDIKRLFWTPQWYCEFRIKTMFGSALPPVVCRRVRAFVTLFVFVCT